MECIYGPILLSQLPLLLHQNGIILGFTASNIFFKIPRLLVLLVHRVIHGYAGLIFGRLFLWNVVGRNRTREALHLITRHLTRLWVIIGQCPTVFETAFTKALCICLTVLSV